MYFKGCAYFFKFVFHSLHGRLW